MKIEVCQHCQTQVVPLSDDTCPSCHFNVYHVLTSDEEIKKAADDAGHERARQSEIGSQELSTGVCWLLISVVVSFVSYGLAARNGSPTGGIYIVASGPILVGVLLIFRSVVRHLFHR